MRFKGQGLSEELVGSLQRLAREYAETVILGILVALFIRSFVVSAYKVPDVNMGPSLLSGDVVLGVKWDYSKFASKAEESVRRGDILVFRCPGVGKQRCIKRVMGLPGDRVRYVNGKISINEQEATYVPATVDDEWQKQPSIENYQSYRESVGGAVSKVFLKPETEGEAQEFTVPDGQLFFLGDHRSAQDDSSRWGMVSVAKVDAKVKMILFSARWSLPGAEYSFFPQIRWSRIGQSL